MPSLKEIVDGYMCKVSGLDVYCSRCLRTERWGGCVVLMVVDAAFTSIGLNYFTSVVPKVEEFGKRFVENGRIRNLKELTEANINELREVWRNRRSWAIARDSGVDTVMPDKIVKRVVNDILVKAGLEPVEDDIEFVKRAEQIALACGYRPIELCWMTWLIQPEGRKIRMEKYKDILPKIWTAWKHDLRKRQLESLTVIKLPQDCRCLYTIFWPAFLRYTYLTYLAMVAGFFET
jgi:hypothetical protein